MKALDTRAWLHEEKRRDYKQEYETYLNTRKHNLQTRFVRAELQGVIGESVGDDNLRKVEDLFYNGFGIIWSPVQSQVFNVLIDCCLPIIYGREWEFVKLRVLKQRGLKYVQQEALVNMARRNGKTFVVSGAAAALWLVIPGLSIAVFSAAKRQAGMFMTATVEKIRMAWDRGTHVTKQGYQKIQENQETFSYEHPTGSKQILGCFPGSVRVSFFFYWQLCRFQSIRWHS